MKKIILTVPHSICLPGETRLEKNCDLSALKFATIFKDELIKNKFDVSLIKPQIYNRKYLDPNRFSTKSQEYGYLTINDSDLWKELRKEISDCNDTNNLIVFDIHSFPNGSFNDSKNIVILDNKPYQKIVLELNEFLKGKKYESTIITAGIGFNAIIDVMTNSPIYIKTLLIEINEDIIDDGLIEIAKLFVLFIKSSGSYKTYVENKKKYLSLKVKEP